MQGIKNLYFTTCSAEHLKEQLTDNYNHRRTWREFCRVIQTEFRSSKSKQPILEKFIDTSSHRTLVIESSQQDNLSCLPVTVEY